MYGINATDPLAPRGNTNASNSAVIARQPSIARVAMALVGIPGVAVYSANALISDAPHITATYDLTVKRTSAVEPFLVSSSSYLLTTTCNHRSGKRISC
jgi:hypothetical protein